jgi:hypothetical protein
MADYDELPLLNGMPVVLKDRAGALPFEFQFDGRTWRKPKDKKGNETDTWSLPYYVAAWLLKRDRDKVHTTTGTFEHRFGLVEPTDELVGELGDEVVITDPITLNPAHVEGWDVASSPMPRERVVYENITARDLQELRAMQRDRQGGALTSV